MAAWGEGADLAIEIVQGSSWCVVAGAVSGNGYWLRQSVGRQLVFYQIQLRANQALKALAMLARTFGTPRAFAHAFGIVRNACCVPNAA